MASNQPSPGQVYLLWAEGTSRFKVGFTSRPVIHRLRDIDPASPFALRVVGLIAASRADERNLHRVLGPFRARHEWFDLPEYVVWALLHLFSEGGYSVLQEA